jgi:hypothetical protein
MASRWAKPDRAGARPASLVCDPVRTTQVLKNSRIGRRPLGFLDSWILGFLPARTYPILISPRSDAIAIASVRPMAFNFFKITFTWLFTVYSLM